MQIKTLVTADDFGFSSNINRAIIDAYKKGRVTEMSLMIDSYGTDEAIKLIKEHKIIDVGLHFSLCRVTRDNKMIRGKEYDFVLNNWTSKQLEKAFDEEVEMFIRKVGYVPKHIIGHKHISLHPNLIKYVAEYCLKNNCYARTHIDHKTLKVTNIPQGIKIGRITDNVLAFCYGSPIQMYKLYKEKIVSLINKSNPSSIEIFFHPGYSGEFEKPLTSFIQERIDDINFLLSDYFLKLIREENLLLVPSSEI